MRPQLVTLAAMLAIGACGGAGEDERNLATAEGNAVAPAAGPDGNPAAPAGAPAPATAADGRQYVQLVGASDLYEIESARLAQQKAERPEVRELAGTILADHQSSTTQLMEAARSAQPAVEAPAPALDAEQQSNLRALQAAAPGAAFDLEYLRQQVRAHERALTLVTAYAAGGDVATLRAHAAQVAGPIQRHLARARDLAAPRPE